MAQRSSTLFIPDQIIKIMFCSSCQLSDHAQGLSNIYHRISLTIQGLQDDKTALQNRVAELEQLNPMAELQRLREENASLQAKLVKTTKEKTEITRERDVLLRKLNGVKQLIDGPAVPQVYFCFPPA
jgi:chromosome segregation ATPase